ncbi:MAG: hypothetical protein JXX29_10960 [Deltaproteobacteria bacterium]|nr:hypothetical protein [Deltaproteobacteria bacterium]MBN2672189.1 hypothetical protein [Deltaproteobacteria bacterium]
MKKQTIQTGILLCLMAALGSCSSPSKVEVRPSPLVLEGKGTKGELKAHIFAENGKELTGDYAVTWMCLDDKTIKIRQDGSVEAVSSGKALVDAEIVGTETPGLPGTGIHGTAEVIVHIPGYIDVSHDEIEVALGGEAPVVWAEVRNDNGHVMSDRLPSWKIDNPSLLDVQVATNPARSRVMIKLTGKKIGETFLTVVYKDFAQEVLIRIVDPEVDTSTSTEES